MKTFSAQDELSYQQLIEKVALIDESAAEYMQHEMRDIDDFAPSDNLWSVVVWCKTAQGYTYWFNIAEEIGQY